MCPRIPPSSPGPTRSVAAAKPSGQERGSSGRFSPVVPCLFGSKNSVQRREATFKLEPNAAQKVRLEAWTRLHRELYNAALGSHALQQTLRRLDLAFAAAFRRVKAGQTPGFPRFKSAKRFSGFADPDLAGWTLMQRSKSHYGTRLERAWRRDLNVCHSNGASSGP